MHWNPDGQMLAVSGRKGILHILNPYIGESIMRWSLLVEDRLLDGFISVSQVQFVAGGQKLAIRISEGTIEVYDFNTNSKQQFSRRKENQVHGMPVSGFCCSSDSSMLVVLEADNTMRFWNIK